MVVEAKNLRAKPEQKDISPTYYLDVPEIAEYGDSRWLVLCVGEVVAAEILAGELPARTGVISWQQLAGLQVGLALSLPIPDSYKRFIAGAIQFQFTQLGVQPSLLAAQYLVNEPSMDVVDRNTQKSQSSEQRERPIWKIGA